MRQTIQETGGRLPATSRQPAGTPAAAAAPPPEGEVKLSFSKLYKVLLDKKPEFDRMLGVTLPNNIFYLAGSQSFFGPMGRCHQPTG